MKRVFKSLFRAFAVVLTTATLFTVGCHTDQTTPTPQPEPEPEPEVVTLSASIENTRTMMNEMGEVLWLAQDKICVYGSEGVKEFILLSGQNTPVGYFRGTLPENNNETYMAGYPSWIWDDAYTLHITGVQKYKDGSFANDTNPMIATFEKGQTEIAFKNLFGILKFQLTGVGTIDNIVIRNEGVQMNGIFDVDPSTLALTAVEGGKQISLEDINVTLGSEPEPFYILVPPGTYSKLTITVNCTDGTTVVREAQQDIVIKRNEVLPLAAIDISAKPKEFLVDAAINEERSGWNRASFDIEYAETCVEAHIGWAQTSDYEGMLLSNPDASVIDIFDGWITNDNLNGADTFDVAVVPNVEYTYIFLGFDAEGNYESRTVTHTAKAELSDEIGVDISVDNLTHSKIDFSFNLTGEVSTLYYVVYNGNHVEDFANPDIVYLNLYHIEGVPVTDSQMSDSIDSLLELSEYTIVVVAEGVDGGLAYAVELVQTLEYQISDASVEVKIIPGDIYADIVLGGDWTSYKYYVIQNADFSEANYNFDTIANELHAASNIEMKTETSLHLSYLNADARHVVVVLPYDENGVYGTVDIREFYTLFPMERSESEAYNNYIGPWCVSYTDWNGNEYPDSVNITIESEVVGSSYLIRGLDLYGNFNDSVIRAYFINNELCIMAGERFMNVDNPSMPYPIISTIRNTSIMHYGYLIGVLNESTITFESSFGGLDSMLISVFDKNYGYMGYLDPIMTNNSWRKVVPTEATGNTEDFTLGQSVDAGWQ